MNVRGKSFVKRTRKGNITKVAKEHYLRDDIPCLSPLCNTCQQPEAKLLNDSKNYYIIPDTNVVLHQLDLLESEFLDDVILLQTVLQEASIAIRKLLIDEKRSFVYFANEHHKDTFVERLDEETSNDYNDRSIRVAAKWYSCHLRNKRIILLTNDTANARGAKDEGINVLSVEEFVTMLEDAYPRVRELLSRMTGKEERETMETDTGKRKIIFDEYWQAQEIQNAIRAERVIEGTFQRNSYNCTEGRVLYFDSKQQAQTVLISGFKNINRAIDGDTVYVEIFRKEMWSCPSLQVKDDIDEEVITEGGEDSDTSCSASGSNSDTRMPTGKVVAIKKRNWRQYCGDLQEKSSYSNYALFIPVDRRIPKIRVYSKRIDDLVDKRLVVCIDSWERSNLYPNGHIVNELGKKGEIETETKVLLCENSIITRAFPKAALDCLPNSDFQFSEDKFKGRKDLRSSCVFSIDPPGCTDIDDALSVETDNDNFVIGVHIADVTSFITQDSALDREAADRSTTVYLADRRIEMLPSRLSSDLCSLKENETRLAFSAFITVDSNANVLGSSFDRSVIQSRKAFTYAEAQDCLDNARKKKNELSELEVSLLQLANIAKLLRKKRFERGALRLSSPELRCFPNCALLRRHPRPSKEMFEPLLKISRSLNMEIDVSSNKSLSRSLDKIEEECIRSGDAYKGTLFRICATRCMTQALYFCSGEASYEEYFHYGLASPLYTHFTSPIRRYADVVVHRMLSSCIGHSTLPEKLLDSSNVKKLTGHLNERHQSAQRAARDSIALHTSSLFRGKTLEEEGRILRLLSNGVVVLLPKYGIEGLIKFEQSNGLPKLNEAEQILITPSGKYLKILDPVKKWNNTRTFSPCLSLVVSIFCATSVSQSIPWSETTEQNCRLRVQSSKANRTYLGEIITFIRNILLSLVPLGFSLLLLPFMLSPFVDPPTALHSTWMNGLNKIFPLTSTYRESILWAVVVWMVEGCFGVTNFLFGSSGVWNRWLFGTALLVTQILFLFTFAISRSYTSVRESVLAESVFWFCLFLGNNKVGLHKNLQVINSEVCLEKMNRPMRNWIVSVELVAIYIVTLLLGMILPSLPVVCFIFSFRRKSIFEENAFNDDMKLALHYLILMVTRLLPLVLLFSYALCFDYLFDTQPLWKFLKRLEKHHENWFHAFIVFVMFYLVQQLCSFISQQLVGSKPKLINGQGEAETPSMNEMGRSQTTGVNEKNMLTESVSPRTRASIEDWTANCTEEEKFRVFEYMFSAKWNELKRLGFFPRMNDDLPSLYEKVRDSLSRYIPASFQTSRKLKVESPKRWNMLLDSYFMGEGESLSNDTSQDSYFSGGITPLATRFKHNSISEIQSISTLAQAIQETKSSHIKRNIDF
eukprot:jgi/Galph1/2847/GphlegSOOS_G1537.1